MSEFPRLLSLLSHELRSPLGVIRGYLRLLEQTGAELSEQHRQAVASALRAADRSAELLGQASMLAQLQRGDTTFDFKPVALSTLVASAVDALQLPNDSAVQIDTTDIAPVIVDADDVLLRGVLTTLMAVVVRSQAQDEMLRVPAHRQEREGVAGVALQITSGAADAALAEVPLNISRGGVGLDLPIAEALVAGHRGQLRELRHDDQYAGMVVWLPTSS